MTVGPEALDLGAAVPSDAAHQALMTSAEARETRREIQLGRLAVYFGITERGRRRPEGPDQGLLPIYDSLTPSEFNNLQLAYYGHELPLFDQFTKGYHVEPKQANVDFYVGGSREQAAVQRQRLVEAGRGTAEYVKIQREMQRQTQHRSDQLCRELHTNAYTAKIRAASLKTTLALIAAGLPLDRTAALFSADAINDFGYSVTANKEMLSDLDDINFGYKISAIGGQAVEDPGILSKNEQLMDLILREQRKRFNYWNERAQFTIGYLGERRLTKKTKEAQVAVDEEIDRQKNIRQNIADAQ